MLAPIWLLLYLKKKKLFVLQGLFYMHTLDERRTILWHTRTIYMPIYTNMHTVKTHTHMYTRIYIYLYIYICDCSWKVNIFEE
jgi:hypothetical protein